HGLEVLAWSEIDRPWLRCFRLERVPQSWVAGGLEERLLDTLLALCREHKLLSARGRQRTDSAHVLGAVRSLNRLACVTETLRAALNVLASAAPAWLRTHANPTWLERYGRPADDYNVPQGQAERAGPRRADRA